MADLALMSAKIMPGKLVTVFLLIGHLITSYSVVNANKKVIRSVLAPAGMANFTIIAMTVV